MTFITDKHLDEWKEKTIDAMKQNFIEDGRLSAVAMIYGRDDFKIYEAEFITEDDKSKFNKFIREEIKYNDALAYIFISEAWMTRHNIEDKNGYKNTDGSYKKPSQSSERIEAAFIIFETSLKNEVITFEIDRSGKKPILINEDRQYGTIGGQFADVLRKPIINN